jgi:hypothetical protein
VQIDAVVGDPHDLREDRVGDERRHRPAVAAREETVQVAAVGQVPRHRRERDRVGDVDEDQRAAELVGVDVRADLPDHLDAVDLVPVHRGDDEQRRPRVDPVDHRDGDETGVAV